MRRDHLSIKKAYFTFTEANKLKVSRYFKTFLTVFKANGKLTSTDGSYLPNLERAEQVLEFLQQACNLANVEFEEELSVILDIGASYLYDEVCFSVFFTEV